MPGHSWTLSSEPENGVPEGIEPMGEKFWRGIGWAMLLVAPFWAFVLYQIYKLTH